ncbi:TMhelix containing protein [Vibrio phage 1.079.O._10N.286.45.E9]|nr:TMhelix containing protein [Vibrio phage 1.079.O._10N.286.45.E9]
MFEFISFVVAGIAIFYAWGFCMVFILWSYSEQPASTGSKIFAIFVTIGFLFLPKFIM